MSSIALYSLDRDLEKTPDGATSAQDVTAEKPKKIHLENILA